MKARVEEIISMYIDALNAGKMQPVDTFLSQFPELPPRTVTGLRKTLVTLEALRRAPSGSEEEQRRASWRRLESRMNIESDNRKKAEQQPAIAAMSNSPTVGEFLSQTLAEDPATLKRFIIPEDVLSDIAEDDSPLQLMQTSPEERFRLAQRYASQDQPLLSQIGALVAHLSRLWRSSTTGSTSSPAYTRPAPPDREKN